MSEWLAIEEKSRAADGRSTSVLLQIIHVKGWEFVHLKR